MLVDSQEQKKLPLGVQRLRLKEHFKTITQEYALKSTQQASVAVDKNLRDLSKLLPSISGLKAKFADVNQTVSSIKFGNINQRSDANIKSHSHDIHYHMQTPKPYTSMSPRNPQYLPLEAKQIMPLPRYHIRTTLPLSESVSLPPRLTTPQFQAYRRGPPGAIQRQRSETKSLNDEYSDYSIMKNFYPYNFDKDKARLKELSD